MVAFDFCPKILGGGRDLRIVVLLKNKYSLSGGDTQTCCLKRLKICTEIVQVITTVLKSSEKKPQTNVKETAQQFHPVIDY